MESIKKIYRIGRGPSSSHTMAPKRAAEKFLAKNLHAHRFRVTLFESLAATGKGHLSDLVIKETFTPAPVEIVWKPEQRLPEHPNGMLFEAFDESGNTFDSWKVYSVGGGALREEGAQMAIMSDGVHRIPFDQVVSVMQQTGKDLPSIYRETSRGGLAKFYAQSKKP